MPAALTLILICPWPGSGSGTAAHFGTSGGPYPVITIALGMAVPSWQRPRYGRGRQISACSLGVFPCSIGRAWRRCRRRSPAAPDRGCALLCPGSRWPAVTCPGPGGPVTFSWATYVICHVNVNMTCHVIIGRKGCPRARSLSSLFRLPGTGHAASVLRRVPVDRRRERALLDDVGVH